MNLVVNARDAMPTGGKLTMETRNVDLDDDYRCASTIGSKPGPHVMLAVTDTGVGMDKATQARIFEPFFTTKEHGKGHRPRPLDGLRHRAAERRKHLGLQRARQGHDVQGLPPARGRPRRGRRVRTQTAAWTLRGTETILLVEDEEQVRAVARSILQRNGYRVIDAQNAGEALLLCEKHPGTIHLLLTDVVMPQMSGRRAGQAARDDSDRR